jgi:hypothetical protein
MANRWLRHLQQFRNKNKGMDAQKVMKEARKSYQNGGAGEVASAGEVTSASEVTPYQTPGLASTASSVGGGKRRRSQRRRGSSRRRSQTRRR